MGVNQSQPPSGQKTLPLFGGPYQSAMVECQNVSLVVLAKGRVYTLSSGWACLKIGPPSKKWI